MTSQQTLNPVDAITSAVMRAVDLYLRELRRRTDPRATAIHEAGHAIVALELGVPIVSAVVVDRSAGIIHINNGQKIAGMVEHQHAHATDEATISVAGVLAEMLENVGDGIPSNSDVAGVCRAIDATGDCPEAVVARAVQTAEEILCRRWGDVLRLSQALHPAGTLSGAEVDALLAGRLKVKHLELN